MQDNFVKETEALKVNLIKMASLVDEQIARAVNAMEASNVEMLKGIKARDNEIDAYDNLIKTQCENILALFQPVATDLRFIMAALMINLELERCGDLAVNIAQRVKKSHARRDLIDKFHLLEMGKIAQQMVKDSIDSFINGNTELAVKVMGADDIVDKMNKDSYKAVTEMMHADAAAIEDCTHLIVMAKHIERLADHATNIAEHLLFYVNAEFASHQKLKRKEENID